MSEGDYCICIIFRTLLTKPKNILKIVFTWFDHVIHKESYPEIILNVEPACS